MLQQIVVQNTPPMTFDIDSVDPSETLIVKNISGLLASDVTLFTGDFAGEGGYYQGRRSGKRNPVITFKLNPDYAADIDISDIRDTLYRQFYQPNGSFGSKGGVKILLKDDRRPDRYFIGYVEKYAGELFSKEQEAQISMLCMEPYLLSETESFFFDAVGWVSTAFTYDGTAETGLDVAIKIKTATNVVVLDLNGDKMTINKPSGTFAVGDTISINTNDGTRYVRHNGVDVMAMLTTNSVWLKVEKPDNIIKTHGSVVGDGKTAIETYQFRSAWWGI